MTTQSPLDRFRQGLRTDDPIAALGAGLIGEEVEVPGPFGSHQILYADYTASGRALRQVEDFVMTEVLPYYANSHTEASFCGRHMTRLRAEARATVARLFGATPEYSVIFAGAGATAGLNRLVGLFGIDSELAAGRTPLVLHGPYEHHSNILPWRESGAEVMEIREAATGGPDMAELENALASVAPGRLVVGAFSAASNVTGIVTDTDAVSALLNQHGARVVWDFAGGAPYMEIDMRAGTAFQKDAVVVSPHKFPGGPGASGLLVVRNAAVTRARPVVTGGGTVRFVSPTGHDYSPNLSAREEAGTPNVIGDIRAALALLAKEAIGQDAITARLAELGTRAMAVWSRNPNLHLLGQPEAESLPIFSFQVRDGQGGYVHQQLFTRMLSDVYGIQARGGCACAGPYAHRLLDIDAATSGRMRSDILAGHESVKPGWTRLNFSPLMSDAKADRLIDAVDELARNAGATVARYSCDDATAQFHPRPEAA